ncbi:hypothetical protein [Mycobacterium phage WXIN]|nr:hypothetical protein [Mycobacterium phage WXIN]
MNRFALDASPQNVYDAVRFGPRWNGWATPVVTRETLIALAANETAAGYPVHVGWLGPSAVVTILAGDGYDQSVYVVPATEDGLLDLGELSWTFFRVDED